MPGVQKNRANMITDITSNIYNNIIKFITGDNVQQRLLNFEISVPNILSDKDAANGYVGLDSNGQMLQTYVAQTLTKAAMDALVVANSVVTNKLYRISNAATTRSLLVRGATSATLFAAATDTGTGETGIYNLTTNKFIPGGLVVFKRSLSNANLLAGGSFDIDELPAPGAGYAWEIVTASGKTTGAGTPFDGAPAISIVTETAVEGQFFDGGEILGLVYNTFAKLKIRDIVVDPLITIVENKKVQVLIIPSSTAGDGTLTIYGSARLITL
jgi:hypothetical protein